jgi:D-alanyl-D-alanine carboxypeptidase
MVLATFFAAALLSAAGAAAPTPIPAPVPTLASPRPSPFGRPVGTPSPLPSPSVASLTTDQMRKVDGIAIGALQSQAVAGLSLAIVRNGRVVYSRGYGFSSVELQQTMRDSALFEIGSITKEFTAAIVLSLVDDGKLTLDAPLSRFVPDYPRGGEITIRDLLAMRSGIPDYTDQSTFDKAAFTPTSPQAIVDTVKQLPLDFDPGTQWEYSNTNYVLLGMVIEKVAGTPYVDQLFQKVVKPLNMLVTSYGDAGASSPDMATGYVLQGDRLRPDKPWDLDWAYSAGGIVSNVLDLAIWDTGLLNGKLLNNADLREMWSETTLKDGTSVPYGYGWTIESLYGHREIDTNGGLPGYNGRNATFPNDQFDVVVLGNSKSFDAGPVVNQIFALFFPPTPAQIAAQTSGDAAALVRSRSIFRQLQAGKLNVFDLLPDAAKHLTPTLQSQAKAQLGPLGAPVKFEQTDKYLLGTQTVYTYRVAFKQVAIGFVLALDAKGKVGSLTVEPL